MEALNVPSEVLKAFGFSEKDCKAERTGSGHINYTFLVRDKKDWILQRINTNVFKEPDTIAANLRLAANHLKQHFPDYLFLNAIQTTEGKEMAFDLLGNPWRLFPYIPDTLTLDKVDLTEQAFEAARGFGELSKKLNSVEVNLFKPTIPKFQDLTWRNEQLETAIRNSTEERKSQARKAMQMAAEFSFLVNDYKVFTSTGKLKPRVVHNDTKINNILFNAKTGKAVCVIDLDTLMPGYFIYDLGDMVRTFVSPVSEEEKDVSKVAFRKPFYDALLEGYLSEMNSSLSAEEHVAIPFAGLMMTYIMAIRFLADFLNGNIYYQIHYPEQNLVRAMNQLTLTGAIAHSLNYRPQ